MHELAHSSQKATSPSQKQVQIIVRSDNELDTLLPEVPKEKNSDLRELTPRRAEKFCNDIASILQDEKKVMLFFDYDGTLTPIVEKADQAIISHEARQILSELADIKNIVVCINSGRDLDSLRELIKDRTPLAKEPDELMRKIWVIAEHGNDFKKQDELPERNFPRPAWMEGVTDLFMKAAKEAPGSYFETKRHAMAFHTRPCEKLGLNTTELEKSLNSELEKIILTNGKLRLQPGSKVIEIVEGKKINKGTALDILASEIKPYGVISAGDDKTDEFMFGAKSLKDAELNYAIKVGAVPEGGTAANLHTESPAQLVQLLRKLVNTLKK